MQVLSLKEKPPDLGYVYNLHMDHGSHMQSSPSVDAISVRGDDYKEKAINGASHELGPV